MAIISVIYKLCMLMVRQRIDKWTEGGLLGDIQCGFRRGRRTEDNLFMLERLIEMVKGRKDEIWLQNTQHTRCYSAMTNPVQIMYTCPAPRNRAPLHFFWKASH